MPCCHLEGEYQGSVTHIGPRVLTFSFDVGASAVTVTPILLSNCATCKTSKAFVFGEGGGKPTALVHGWYILQTDVDIYVQQVNPKDACKTNPIATGIKVSAGGTFCFFVAGAVVDGILVIQICASAIPGTCLLSEIVLQSDFDTAGLVRVNRLNTVRTMAETGDTADLADPPASVACGGPPGPVAP